MGRRTRTIDSKATIDSHSKYAAVGCQLNAISGNSMLNVIHRPGDPPAPLCWRDQSMY